MKVKMRRLFSSRDEDGENNSEAESVQGMSDIERDPAFNPGQLVNKRQISAEGAKDKTLHALQQLGRIILYPKDTIKSKATKTTAKHLSKAERPYLSQKADLDFLEAHEGLKRAESSSSSRHGVSDEEIDSDIIRRRDKIREMEMHRESLHAAWTTSRHVRRVRVVPKRHIAFPEVEYFTERDNEGNIARYDWLKWLGYNLIYYTQDFNAQYIDEFDELPFDVDSSRHHVERLVMASAPWQSWAMNVRAVYRWENPNITGMWFALYVVLWYTQHVMGFLYAYIIYIVLKNRFYPTSAESLRISMQRAHDSQSKAYKLGEFIDRHGRHNWLEPVMRDLGPYIQLQVGDMANMLEVFSNFYHWKHPRKTVATLLFFISCLIVSFFADMAFCMKIVWLIFGGSFFLCWPVASLHPRYRYLVSPLKWVFWDIPTHAEWSFQYLRRQAQATREALIKRKVEEGRSCESADPIIENNTGRMTAVPKIKVGGAVSEEEENADSDSDSGWHSASSTSSVLETTDVRSFSARCKGVTGRLIIFSNGVRFVRSPTTKEVWRILFIELKEMRKWEGTWGSKLLSSPEQLEIKSTDDRKVNIGGMKKRDEAFNTIIAFSGLQWQNSQIRHDIPE